MIKRISCHISGRVQMVMYRDFAVRNAKKLAICGYVKNLENGQVYLEAEGEESSLAAYIEELKRGPVLAHVETVETIWSEPKNEWDHFQIIYD